MSAWSRRSTRRSALWSIRRARPLTRRAASIALALLVIWGMLLTPAAPLAHTAYAQEPSPVEPAIEPMIEPMVEPGMAMPIEAAPVTEEGTAMSPAVQSPQTTNGLTILLGAGAEGADQGVSGPPVAEGEPLTDAETQALIDRTDPITPTGVLTEEFRLPPESLPPPVAGTTITETFPPTGTESAPQTVTSGPLEVLRYAPQGEIPIAPFLNVTFNQPMVPLATLDELSALDVPVQVTPEISGVWKWLGTTTLSFEYRGDDLNRFPMATVYTATIPAGTESAVGGVLAETVTWSFSTPTPTVVTTYPTFGPQSREPLLFVAFDQRIDPQAVLPTITASAGGQPFALRLATQDEVAADKTVSSYVEYAG
jgi:hypothetical protein